MNTPGELCFVGSRGFYQVGVLYQASVHICLIKATRLAEMFCDWCAHLLFDFHFNYNFDWNTVYQCTDKKQLNHHLYRLILLLWQLLTMTALPFDLSLELLFITLCLGAMAWATLSSKPGSLFHACCLLPAFTQVSCTWWLPLWLRDMV